MKRGLLLVLLGLIGVLLVGCNTAGKAYLPPQQDPAGTCVYCGDLNLDGKTDFRDLGIVSGNFNNQNATIYEGDLNGDGITDFGDLPTLQSNFNVECQDAYDIIDAVSNVYNTSVYLNGVYKGNTNEDNLLRIRPDQNGTFEVRFVKEGYSDDIQWASLDKGCDVNLKWGNLCDADCNGKQCGDDGCGGTCGTCQPGQICDDGSCCTPLTCEQLGKECGLWSDGCVGTLNCGTCLNGTTCENGACVEPGPSCTDDDGGVVYDIKGTTSDGTTTQTDKCYVLGGGGAVASCSSTDPNCRLAEYYCYQGTTTKNLMYDCPNGCEDGECVEAPACTDTDGGINYYEKGTKTNSSGSETDFCIYQTNELQEFYCDGYDYYNCDDGNTDACVNGTCVVTSPQTGSWWITSDPTDAEIRIDGTYIGTTSWGAGGWPVGTYLVSISKTGYYGVNLTRSIIADQQTHVHADLENQTVCGDGVCNPEESRCGCSADCGYLLSCTDSDGGIVPGTYGTVESTCGVTVNDRCAIINTGSIGYRSSCTTSETNCGLVEYYCNSENMRTPKHYHCLDGCSNGVCLNPVAI